MTRRGFLKIDTRTGRVIDDDDVVIRDGQRIVVPMAMKDSMSPIQRAVVEDAERRADDAAKRLGLADALDLHRPGQRFSTDQAACDARERAYQDSKRELQDAWRTRDAAPSSGEVVGARPVDKCIVPDQRRDAVPRMMDAAAAQAIRDAAYEEFVRSHEWKP
jgi:hypothetical protein